VQAAASLPDTAGDRMFFENDAHFVERTGQQAQRLLRLAGALVDQVRCDSV
jgi:hypothetical protein